jgi:DNA polymerase-3 subunit alpha
MAFVTIDGLDGTIEVPCFPKVYTDNRELLEEDRVLKIRGRVDRKDESEMKLIPATIEPFVVRKGDEPITLVLDGERLPRQALEDLKAVIRHFPGVCPVVVQVLSGERATTLRFGDGYRVDPQTSFFAELQVLLGEGCVTQS